MQLSFEFSPNLKSAKSEATLLETAHRLSEVGPRFMTVTYGAGGSTRETTRHIAAAIQERTGIPTAAHLTCIGATREETDTIAESFWQQGIRHIVALRGDPPGFSNGNGYTNGNGHYPVTTNGYRYAGELVTGLKTIAPFEISVAAYPEKHPQAESQEKDLDYLKRKIDAGATRAISQFFFDNDHFLRFIERARKAGIRVPIVAGMIAVSNFPRVAEFAAKCGSHIPERVRERFENTGSDAQAQQAIAAEFLYEQCTHLLANGVKEFHFYTFNKADIPLAVCRQLQYHNH